MTGTMSIDEALDTFMQREIPGVLLHISDEESKAEFFELLKLLVLAHRHNRSEEFFSGPPSAFDVVRNTMYKYSKQAQDRFFSHAAYAFLFLFFSHSDSGKRFAADYFDKDDDPMHSERMCREVNSLAKEARACLEANKSPLAKQLLICLHSEPATAGKF